MDAQALGVIVLVLLIHYGPTIYEKIINNIKLWSIPTVGTPDPFTSYIGAFQFQKHAKEMVEHGYYKYRRSIFKVPMLTHWMIIVSGLDNIDDLRRAPEDVLSMMESVTQSTDLDPSFRFIIENLVHVVRTPLTRNIRVRFPDVRDEIITTLNDLIPARNAWVKVRAYSTMREILCRVSNRMLVGVPLCRDLDYLELNKQFTIDMIKCASTLNIFPRVLRPWVAPFLGVAKGLKRGVRHMGPFVKERLEQEARYGKDWPDRPNDLLTWLSEVMDGKECTVREITAWILLISFVSVHSPTIAITYTLYDLAARPEYVQPLREEIEAIVEKEGWSQDAVAKMTKLDSFVKETMRISSVGTCQMMRKTLKDFTFTDGTTIPAGNIMCIPTSCINTDPDIYTDAGTFDGFRFEKIRKKSKHSLVSLDLDYLLFGHGGHACPGRFFAANELKTMIGHIVMNYDVKMAGDGGRPENVWFGHTSFPSPNAEVLFRKRV